MNTSALIMMVTTEAIISAITFYYFWKVLKTPAKKEPDSYSENDDVKR
ncbi:MAG: hypothetical protein HY841_07595 [Bacteroidetes bacterium]|nr:hypothetical protein [Bacteroidota bacterium]